MPSCQLPLSQGKSPTINTFFNQQLPWNACTYRKTGFSWNLVRNQHTQNRDPSHKTELVMSKTKKESACFMRTFVKDTNENTRKCMGITGFPSLQFSKKKPKPTKTKANQVNIKTVIKTIPSWSTELVQPSLLYYPCAAENQYSLLSETYSCRMILNIINHWYILFYFPQLVFTYLQYDILFSVK